MFGFIFRLFSARGSQEQPERTSIYLGTLSIAERAMPIPRMAKGVGETVEIGYVDIEGIYTERVVTLLSLPRNPTSTFQAICGLRGAERSFRVDRVEWIRDLNAFEKMYEPFTFLAGSAAKTRNRD